MSKAKEVIQEVRNRFFDRKKQQVIDESTGDLEKLLKNETYAVIQNPQVKNRAYLIIKIKFDLEADKAVIVGATELDDKTAGLGMLIDQENRKYLFDKSNKRSKK